MSAISKRRSVRSFSSGQISRLDIESIVKAASLAPSSKNSQPWKFIVVDRPSDIQLLAECAGEAAKQRFALRGESDVKDSFATFKTMRQAAALIFVLYENDCCQSLMGRQGVFLEGAEMVDLLSVGAAIENMLLRAVELEVGSLWCGDHLFVHDELAKALGVDKPIVAMVCLGYQDAPLPPQKRKPLSMLLEWFGSENAR